MHMMATADPAEVVELAERQQHGRDTSEQHQQAQRAPQQRTAGGDIAHAGVVGKVVGVRRIRTGPCRHRSEEHTSELQSLMRISYAVFCLKKNTTKIQIHRSKMTHNSSTLNE